MKRKYSATAFYLCFLFVSQHSLAQSTLMAARVGAEDVIATGAFYENTFELELVNRIELGAGRLELILEPPNGGTGIVILQRESDADAEAIPHLIFRVTDLDASYAKAIEAGGTVETEPFDFAQLNIRVALVKDPAGNIVELLQQL